MRERFWVRNQRNKLEIQVIFDYRIFDYKIFDHKIPKNRVFFSVSKAVTSDDELGSAFAA